MHIIVSRAPRRESRCIHLGRHYLLPAIVGIAMGVGLLALGYQLGSQDRARAEASSAATELDRQRDQVAAARQEAEASIAVLTRRIAELESEMARIEAVGGKLVEMAGLDGDEFDFSRAPAVGGPHAPDGKGAQATATILEELDALARRLEDRQAQLQVLDRLVMTRRLEETTSPAGQPVASGWQSSPFGQRKDPFTGAPDFHDGVDFAAQAGTDIVAVAGGVVTSAGNRPGYGNLVEINHGSGYMTRYAHCLDVTVAEGDTVSPGDVVAHVGNTGRSTGPHVHFEVLHQGDPVDPEPFIQASR